MGCPRAREMWFHARRMGNSCSILGLKVASGFGKARGKQLGVRPGPAERILLLRGKMDGAVKPLGAWWEGWKPESGGHQGVGRLRTNWDWQRWDRGSRRWDASKAGVCGEGLWSLERGRQPARGWM